MPPVKSKGGRMMALINYRLRVTLNDARQLTGRFLAFDVHMNMVLAETEEFRRIKPKKRKASKAVKKQKTAHGEDAGGARVEDDDEDDEEPAPAEQEQKRALGLIILRGENIISVSVEAPPAEPKRDAPTVRTPSAAYAADQQMAPGPGHAAPTGRGAGLPPMMGRPMPYGPPPGGPPPGFPARPFGPPPGFAGPPPGFGGPPPGFRPSGPPGFMPPPPS